MFHVNNKIIAATRDRTGDLQIFSLTLSQLSYHGLIFNGVFAQIGSEFNELSTTNLKFDI